MPLSAVIPALVMGDGKHLTLADKLVLFRSSKTNAVAFLQHSPCITLTLRPSSSQQQHATAMQLASHAPSVTLVLHSYLITPSADLWQRIKALHLAHMTLSATSLHPMADLPHPARLRTLRLTNCTFIPSTTASPLHSTTCHITSSIANAGCTSPAAQPHSPSTQELHSNPLDRLPQSSTPPLLPDDPPHFRLSVPHLVCSYCSPPDACLNFALAALSVDDLHHLDLDSQQTQPIHLPQLVHLHALKKLSVSGYTLADNELQTIFLHPTLTQATLDGLRLALQHDCPDLQPLSLQQLDLLQGCHITNLAALPLSRLRQLAVHSCLSLQHDVGVVESAVAKVLPHAAKVVARPTTHKDCWDPSRATFELLFPEDCPPHVAEQTLVLVSPHLEEEIMLSWAPASVLPAVHAALAPQVRHVTFFGDLFQVEELPSSFLNQLPDHVDTVILGKWYMSLDLVRKIITGVRRPIKILFFEPVVEDPEAVSEVVEEAARPPEPDPDAHEWFSSLLQGWVREAYPDAPGRVTVEVLGKVTRWP